MSQNIRVLCADTPELRRAVHRLRYKVFVEELQYRIPGTDAETGVRASSDDTAWLALACDGDEPIGTLALNRWDQGPLDEELVRHFHLEHFAQHFSRASISVLHKAMVLEKYRGTPVFQQMLVLACMSALNEKSQFLFLDCSPSLVHYYERWGARRYAPHFFYDDTGILSVPMVMVLSDHEHLARKGSVGLEFARTKGIADSPAVRAYFARHWTLERPSDRLEPDSPLLLPPTEETRAFDIFTSKLFEGLTTDEIRFCLEQGAAPHPFGRKDTLIKAGASDGCVYLLADGYVEVAIEKNGQQLPVATAGPGDLLGEVGALLGIAPTANVVALTEGGALRLSVEQMARLLDSNARVGAVLYRNLARHVAERLRTASLWITERPPL